VTGEWKLATEETGSSRVQPAGQVFNFFLNRFSGLLLSMVRISPHSIMCQFNVCFSKNE
jgi:hypothetical protein